MSTTGWNMYRPPGRKSIDNPSDTIDSVPTFVKNTALRFLQIVYAQRPEGDLKYIHDDEEGTNIKIVDQYAYQLDSNDMRPAIVGVRGSISWSNVGISSGLQELNMKTGQEKRTDLMSGSVALNCLSRVGLEAEQMASDVFNLFKSFKTTLTKFGFFTVRSMNIGPEQLIQAQGEADLFMVSVLIQCQVQDRWMLEPKSAAELRKVVLETLVDETEMSKTNLEGGS